MRCDVQLREIGILQRFVDLVFLLEMQRTLEV